MTQNIAAGGRRLSSQVELVYQHASNVSDSSTHLWSSRWCGQESSGLSIERLMTHQPGKWVAQREMMSQMKMFQSNVLYDGNLLGRLDDLRGE